MAGRLMNAYSQFCKTMTESYGCEPRITSGISIRPRESLSSTIVEYPRSAPSENPAWTAQEIFWFLPSRGFCARCTGNGKWLAPSREWVASYLRQPKIARAPLGWGRQEPGGVVLAATED